MPTPVAAPSNKSVPEERISEEKVAPRRPTGTKALVCPRCRARFDDTPPAPTHCPRDNIQLVRVRELTEAGGDPMLGRTLDGRFTILGKLGAGSMGTVYRARQHAMGRDVAIKILRGDKALDESAKGRFLREARANSLLTSPHTVTVFDFGQAASGELYLAMELLEGESLGQRLVRVGRLSPAEAIDTCRQALRSVGEAHAKGIVHRDLKPDNLFYARLVGGQRTNEEVLKVLDFGIAKLVGDTGDMMNAIETQAGTVFGTPRYMSPEQAQGKPLDARSDLYSMGVILYHMLTGRPPFTDDDAVVVMARHIKTVAVPMSEVCPDATFPPELEALVGRLLAKEPDMRPRNAEAVTVELTHLIETGVAGTSGVRSSIGLSTPPPPLLDGLGARPPSADTLALAGIPSNPWSRGLLAFSGLAVLGLAAVLTFSRSSSPSATSPTSGQGPSAVVPAGRTPPPPRADPWPSPPTTSQPAAPEVPSAEPTPSIPTLSVEDLPRAASPLPADTGKGAGRRPPRGASPKPAASSSAAANGGAAPAPSSAPSAGYGYLE